MITLSPVGKLVAPPRQSVQLWHNAPESPGPGRQRVDSGTGEPGVLELISLLC